MTVMREPPDEASMRWPRVAPSVAFAAALRGEPCLVVGLGLPAGADALPAWRWRAVADAADQVLLSRCRGATVDIGCGPGRMTEALMARGVTALGIDIVSEAVEQTRARGAAALERDVFKRLPGEGRWETALLADGNIGIGGDPVRLLRRAHELLVPGGKVVLDLADPGGPVRVHRIGLQLAGVRTALFPWAIVPADQIELVAEAAALRVREVARHGDRWFAELDKES